MERCSEKVWSNTPRNDCPECDGHAVEVGTDGGPWTDTIHMECERCGTRYTWWKSECEHGLTGWFMYRYSRHINSCYECGKPTYHNRNEECTVCGTKNPTDGDSW